MPAKRIILGPKKSRAAREVRLTERPAVVISVADMPLRENSVKAWLRQSAIFKRQALWRAMCQWQNVSIKYSEAKARVN
jgi:hypothetical protein